MTQVMQEVLDLLALETIEAGLFRGPSHNIVGKNVFGGQVLGQALMAAGRTANSVLNSDAARRAVLGQPVLNKTVADGGLLGFSRVAPLLTGQ